MIRYRCPHCATLIVAHERRVAQSSVCKACLKTHQIPADTALWLTESGALLHPPAPAVPVLAPTVLGPLPVPARDEPELAAASRDELSPTVLDPHPSEPEPIFVGLPTEPVPLSSPAPVAREPDPVAAPRSPRPVARQPRPVPAASAEAGHAVATAEPPAPTMPTSTPPPRGRLPAPVPGPQSGDDTPPPGYGEPVQLQTQADIALALTAALTSRMKPPPAPRGDLRPSTAVWMLLTGVGVAFVLIATFSDLGYRWAALAVGAAQVVVGYAWIVRLTSLRHPMRGLACALPPATFYYLAQYKYAKFRPLRFVLTGAALAGLAVAAPDLAALARPLVGPNEQKAAPPDPAAQSKLAQLRTLHDQRAYAELVRLIQLLAKTDPIRSADAGDRAELAAELEALCGHQLTHVRIEAMTAFTRWDPTPNAARARAVCVAAIRSPTQDERIRALQLLPDWKDAESARAVQSLIGRADSETNLAKEALEKIGGAPAEQVALALLKRDDLATRLIAISILENVGGPETAKELRLYAMAADDPLARTRAQAAAAVIDARTPKP